MLLYRSAGDRATFTEYSQKIMNNSRGRYHGGGVYMKKVSALLVLLMLFIVPLASSVADAAPIDKAKIQVVEWGEQFKVKIVKWGADYRIRLVDRTPFSHGEWQIVEHFADYKVKFVKWGEDFTVEFVN